MKSIKNCGVKSIIVLTEFIVMTIQAHAAPVPIVIGAYQSRALISAPENASANQPSPAVILLPGSGEFGPEEMIPKKIPPAGSDGYPYLSLFAEQFAKAGFHTLQLGKPGVERFSDWESFQNHTNFYNRVLWDSLTWSDMIANVHAAVEMLRRDPSVAKDQIYVLGHSEGTMLATDVAAQDSQIAGVILLGYCGEVISSVLRWQVLEKNFDLVIKTDIDANHDGYVDENEAKLWPKTELFPPSFSKLETPWNWSERPQIPLQEIKNMWTSDPLLTSQIEYSKWTQRFPFWRGDFWNRANFKETTASISGKVFAFTGENDVNTPVSFVRSLKEQCLRVGKQDCEITIIPGLTHLFAPINSVPVGPKLNMVVDQGLNPPDEDFLKRLNALAKSLNKHRQESNQDF